MNGIWAQLETMKYGNFKDWEFNSTHDGDGTASTTAPD